jgi:hypothetical protein
MLPLFRKGDDPVVDAVKSPAFEGLIAAYSWM